MRVFLCRFEHPILGAMLSWHGSKRDAKAHLARQQRTRDRQFTRIGMDGVEPIDVPRSKDELLGWLNKNLYCDR